MKVSALVLLYFCCCELRFYLACMTLTHRSLIYIPSSEREKRERKQRREHYSTYAWLPSSGAQDATSAFHASFSISTCRSSTGPVASLDEVAIASTPSPGQDQWRLTQVSLLENRPKVGDQWSLFYHGFASLA